MKREWRIAKLRDEKMEMLDAVIFSILYIAYVFLLSVTMFITLKNEFEIFNIISEGAIGIIAIIVFGTTLGLYTRSQLSAQKSNEKLEAKLDAILKQLKK